MTAELTAERTAQTMGVGRPMLFADRSRVGVGRVGSPMPIWLPWLVAPLFMLMPMGGCALAGRLRQAAATAVASPVQVAPVATVVTVARD